jgi:hypothetical protein
VTNQKMKKKAAKRLVALATGLTMAVGATSCYSGYYDPYYYDYVYYDPYYYGYDTWYAYTWVDPIYYDYYALSTGQSTPADLNSMASNIAAQANSYYGNGCGTATATGATVAFVLNNCIGPGGQGTVTGNIGVTLTQAATGEITITAGSPDLTINGERYIMDMSMVPTTTNGTSAIAITSRSYSPSRFDSRTANMTLSWVQGSDCFDVSGDSQATKGGMSATATVEGFHQCANVCPSGGTVTVNTPNGAFSSTFDGGDQFEVSGPDGTVHSYDMDCNPT